MRGRFLVLVIMALLMSQMGINRAEAFVFIHEFLADPASGLAGDANNDGVRDSYDDEFVELFNLSSSAVDLAGWYITDSANSGTVRHTFGINSQIDPYDAFVIFGGGTPNLLGIDWQVASSGSLALNNGGDTITLYDSSDQVVDFYAYGSEASDDQSLVRNSEGSKGKWIKHALSSNSDNTLFSPGYLINPTIVTNEFSSTVPEPGTIFSIALGFGIILLKRKQ